ncbi:hypothetical protein [Herbiconiux sp. L3-i23]|uniref:hypothetical protein n=1 Tax=Herbiconiux sp. L3-i23 TaxID=2905871 RepID=UPI00205D3A7B|nr:hypothetical protein [Herbiconiux sp. L3-i23]BDI22907.1 hypothetical protein L3i23_16830 [Herbiconiux sp. L3-i23]
MRAYVEVQPFPDEAGAHEGASPRSDSTRAWAFDLAHWGVCRTADTTAGALSALQRATRVSTIELEEVVEGPDPAFSRDLEPASPGERAATLSILDAARRRTLELVAGATEDQLTRPAAWAPHVDAQGWESAEALAWSFADAESRTYLPALGLPTRPRLADLALELQRSHAHVVRQVQTLEDVRIRTTAEGGEWTSVKLLRILAWRERSLLPLFEELLAQG